MSKRKRRDWNKKSPLEYFREHFGDREITRRGLEKEDSGLYNALKRRGLLNEAIPGKLGVTYRGYDSPLECFRENFGDRRDMTRTQLGEEDRGLYYSLMRRGLLNEAIPESYRRDWNKKSPLEYFREKFGDREGMTRSQLGREDSGLYGALWKRGLLDEAIPDKAKRDFKGNPLEYFREHYRDREMTRGQLYKEDKGLYVSLLKHNQMEGAIPKKYRGYASPLECFNDLFGDGKGVTRWQLQREDNRLYHVLRNHGQLDQAIPVPGKQSEKEKLEQVLRNYSEGSELEGKA